MTLTITYDPAQTPEEFAKELRALGPALARIAEAVKPKRKRKKRKGR